MNDENNFGAPVLDDIDYVEPTPKKEGPTGLLLFQMVLAEGFEPPTPSM